MDKYNINSSNNQMVAARTNFSTVKKNSNIPRYEYEEDYSTYEKTCYHKTKVKK